MKEYKDSTLMSWNKAQLVEHIKCTEQNYHFLLLSFEQLCKNFRQIDEKQRVEIERLRGELNAKH